MPITITDITDVTKKTKEPLAESKVKICTLTVGELREAIAYLPAELSVHAGINKELSVLGMVLECKKGDMVIEAAQDSHDIVIYDPTADDIENIIYTIIPTKLRLDEEEDEEEDGDS